MHGIATALGQEADAGRRVLAGFDFPFGYPAGTASRLAGRDGWHAMWGLLADLLPDQPRNKNDRFSAAADLNRRFPHPGPFWATLPKTSRIAIPRRKPAGYGTLYPDEYRVVERICRRLGAQPKSVWQLSGPGNVGGQVLTGIAALARLKRNPELAHHMRVWPLETGLAVPDAPIVLAEIYPSLVPPDPDERVRDAGQVRAVAECFAALDAGDRLAPLFDGPDTLTATERDAIEAEEAWILGAGFESFLREAAQ